jgi:hypothetical protein
MVFEQKWEAVSTASMKYVFKKLSFSSATVQLFVVPTHVISLWPVHSGNVSMRFAIQTSSRFS